MKTLHCPIKLQKSYDLYIYRLAAVSAVSSAILKNLDITLTSPGGMWISKAIQESISHLFHMFTKGVHWADTIQIQTKWSIHRSVPKMAQNYCSLHVAYSVTYQLRKWSEMFKDRYPNTSMKAFNLERSPNGPIASHAEMDKVASQMKVKLHYEIFLNISYFNLI